jgi:hypothetical protein
VNSCPNEIVIVLEPESVVGVWVGVVEVGVGDVGIGVGTGGVVVRWLKTKYPIIPAITTIPIMIAMFTNPFWFINLYEKISFALPKYGSSRYFSGSLAVRKECGEAAATACLPRPPQAGEAGNSFELYSIL